MGDLMDRLDEMKTASSAMNAALKAHTRVSKEISEPCMGLLKAINNFLKSHEKMIIEHEREMDAKNARIDEILELNQHYKVLAGDLQDKVLTSITELAQQQQKQVNQPSYSDALKGRTQGQDAKKEIVAIKSKDRTMNTREIKTSICNKYKSNQIKCTNLVVNKNNVIFEFDDDAKKKEFIKLIADDEQLKLEAFEPGPKCPMIVIRNVDKETNEIDLIENMIDANNLREHADRKNFRIVFTTKRKYTYDATIVISPHVFKLIENFSVISVGWNSRRLEETYVVEMCRNCYSYNHRTKFCPIKGKLCRGCCKEFPTMKIDEDGKRSSPFWQHISECRERKCKHCPVNNNNHRPDTEECPVYRLKLRKLKSMICYDGEKKVTFYNSNVRKDSSTSPVENAEQQSTSNVSGRIVVQ